MKLVVSVSRLFGRMEKLSNLIDRELGATELSYCMLKIKQSF
jgi:hypothetical protein